jgi:mono/diheme cytochrome c family protein
MDPGQSKATDPGPGARARARFGIEWRELPGWVVPAITVLVVLSFIPLALIARSRTLTTSHTRLQIIPDMDQQPKFKTQSMNPLFADLRAMRPEVPGTVAWGAGRIDSLLELGISGGRFGTSFPFPLSEAILKRGRERFDIYCSPCHGLAGRGDGIVNVRAERLQEGTWTPPADLTSDLVAGREAGHIYNTIKNGIRNMPAYGPQIAAADRWAIVAYVRALQRSRRAPIEDVPAELRPSLREEQP